jgi:hypothetical protein
VKPVGVRGILGSVGAQARKVVVVPHGGDDVAGVLLVDADLAGRQRAAGREVGVGDVADERLQARGAVHVLQEDDDPPGRVDDQAHLQPLPLLAGAEGQRRERGLDAGHDLGQLQVGDHRDPGAQVVGRVDVAREDVGRADVVEAGAVVVAADQAVDLDVGAVGRAQDRPAVVVDRRVGLRHPAVAGVVERESERPGDAPCPAGRRHVPVERVDAAGGAQECLVGDERLPHERLREGGASDGGELQLGCGRDRVAAPVLIDRVHARVGGAKAHREVPPGAASGLLLG